MMLSKYIDGTIPTYLNFAYNEFWLTMSSVPSCVTCLVMPM